MMADARLRVMRLGLWPVQNLSCRSHETLARTSSSNRCPTRCTGACKRAR